jgi:YfiR/HmsC-like
MVAVATLAGAGASAGTEAPEYEVKAEFLERFTRFIDWPLEGDEKPFTIGVIGRNPFGAYLDRVVASHKIKGRQPEIRYVDDLTQIDRCQVLFIAASERDRLPKILARTGSRPILTVSDSAGFASAGVLINFYTAAETVRFEINEAAVEKSGLKVSAQLLKLARLIERGEGR